MDANININLLANKKLLRSKSNVMIDGESEMEKKLRSKKSIMIDGETEEEETYIDTNGNITNKPKAKMLDIAHAYKPEEVVKRETGVV